MQTFAQTSAPNNMLVLRRIPAMLGSGSSLVRGPAVRFPMPVAPAARPRGVLFCSAVADKKTGTVKWFDVTKGYGFIAPEDGSSDLFVHQTSILTDGFRSLREGEPVEFIAEQGNDGRLRAVDVTGPGGANPQGAPPREQFGGGMRRGGGNGGGGGRRGGGGGFGRDDYDDGSYRY